MTSQGEWKKMGEGMDNVEGHLSCHDSSYNEHNLRFPTAAMVFTVEVRTRNTAVEVWMCWERNLTSLNLLKAKTTLHPAPTSPQDGLDPLQLALVLICMCTHTNEHVVQLALCGGDLCSVLCGVCVCTSACVTVCSNCDVRVVWCLTCTA